MTNSQQFTALSRFLHWLMAILIITMLFIGVGMVVSLSNYHLLLSIHKPLGISVLILAAVRLINRLLNPPPPLPDHMPGWQKLAAKSSHVLLYILMFALPLVGWSMLSAARYPIVLYGSLHLPYILPHAPEVYVLLRKVHTGLAYMLFATIAIHVSAALMHGLIYRDGVFGSMASWKKKGGFVDI
jgi:cytochrome b561